MSEYRGAAFYADACLATVYDASACAVATHNGAVAHNGALAHNGAVAHDSAMAHNGAMAYNGAVAHDSVAAYSNVTTHSNVASETRARGAPGREAICRPSCWRDEGGSLTVEALLILPVMLLLMVLFVRWGIILRDDLRSAAAAGHTVRQQDGLGAGIAGTDAGAADTGANGAGANGTGAADAGGSGEAGIGFLVGGPPARRIRDADLLIDLGYTIKEKLPGWIKSIIK